jgi:hypothetical protein
MIWEATFVPRILHITIKQCERHMHPQPPNPGPCTIRTRCEHHQRRLKALEKPPIALEVCYESRAVALKHYKPSFQSLAVSQDGNSDSFIYFNPELPVDTVHMVDPLGDKVRRTLYHTTNQETIEAIKVLACDGHPHKKLVRWADQSRRLKSIWGHLLAFKKLEVIIFMVKSEDGENANSICRIQDSLSRALLQDKSGEGVKAPVVRVMDFQAFEAEYQGN